MVPFAGQKRKRCRGFTIIEFLIVVAIVIVLAALVLPAYKSTLDKAKIARAIGDISVLIKEITLYQVYNEELPDTLTEVGWGSFLDPYGNPYQYLKFSPSEGNMRKDGFGAPLNSSYDLYSKGKDGKSVPPLMAEDSWDDIVRANDGGYIGPAFEY